MTVVKHNPIPTLLFLLFSVIALAQTGKVFDDLSMHSDILSMERKYAVYLPPDYEHSERRYPVLYLLHGGGDDQTGWVQFGEVLRIADQAIQHGSATAMIIVMPDANSGHRGYFNRVDGSWDYEDFFFDEFIPEIEQKFRIKGEKRYRAVGGLSMGGGGSFMYALHRPDLFSSSCPLSAYVGPLSFDQARQRYAKQHIDEASEDVLRAHYERHNALYLIDQMDAEQIAEVRWFIDCGDDDFLFEGNSLVHIALKKKEVDHEYRVRDGAHTWTYWRESLPFVLRFVSDAFHQH
ncbi:MAG: esterase family protein [Saprospiraceae bacterium]|nr:esterase family protein [Saprospiraceae bacterium]